MQLFIRNIFQNTTNKTVSRAQAIIVQKLYLNRGGSWGTNTKI